MNNGKKIVFIIGCRGYGINYGGWETFVKNLIDNWRDGKTQFYIYGVTQKRYKDKIIENNNGILCPQVYIPGNGCAMMMFFCIKALVRLIRYCKNNNIENAVLYILGVRAGPMFLFIKRELNKRNIKIIINPDGLEWSRAKWNRLVKWYLLISEAMMIKYADCIVCDSRVIAKYIKDKYRKLKSPVRYISYGVCFDKDKKLPVNEFAAAADKKEKTFFEKFRIRHNQYFLIVARFVPENNFLLIIREFMCTRTKRDLVIISNIEKNAFFRKLKQKTGFDEDKRIKLIGPVYDKELLKKIRRHAFAYLHGHMAGGTNPGLLEAMSLTKINILYDVDFNREVGEDGAYYFDRTPDSLSRIINRLENIPHEETEKYGLRAKQRMIADYSWDRVVADYELLFNKMLS